MVLKPKEVDAIDIIFWAIIFVACIATAQTMSHLGTENDERVEWVEVSGELPEEEVCVSTMTSDLDVTIGFYFHGKWYEADGSQLEIKDVEYWRPLYGQ